MRKPLSAAFVVCMLAATPVLCIALAVLHAYIAGVPFVEQR